MIFLHKFVCYIHSNAWYIVQSTRLIELVKNTLAVKSRIGSIIVSIVIPVLFYLAHMFLSMASFVSLLNVLGGSRVGYQ